MLENITGGLAGLILFLSQWLSPAGEQASLTISDIRQNDHRFTISCQLKIGWNEQLSDLIDAGIPMRFRFSAETDDGQKLRIVRTLQCNITDYTYQYTDSLRAPSRDSAWTSDSYNQILIAMRQFTRWTFSIHQTAKECRIEAVLLPSRVSRLNRSIDVSNLCGCRKISKNVIIQN